jgi:soluble lytic murein transglycosylase-like protein
MPVKTRQVVNGALLSAAVTALAVKSTLASPIDVVAQGPLQAVKKGLSDASIAALADLQPLVDQAQARVVNLKVGSGTPSNFAQMSGRAPMYQALSPATAPSVGTDAMNSARHATGRARMRNILVDAARRHGVDPKLVLALAYWESGWDQTRVSASGAVGLMQVEPATAQAAGPSLLGRAVDISDPQDNADVGVAIFREDLDNYATPSMALAAYYQGPTSLTQDGLLPDTQRYVEGILSLASQLSP